MNIEEVRYFALSLPGVTEDQPFGDDNITFRVEGKIFMCLWLGGGKYNIDETMLRFACVPLEQDSLERRVFRAIGYRRCRVHHTRVVRSDCQ